MSDAADQTPTDKEIKAADGSEKSKRALKIGSQRPGHENVGRAVGNEMPKPSIDGTGATTWEAPLKADQATPAAATPPAAAPAAKAPATPAAPATPPTPPVQPTPAPVASEAAEAAKTDFAPAPKTAEEEAAEVAAQAFPKPRVTHLSPELQTEIDAALAGVSLDALMDGGGSGSSRGPEPPIDSRVRATVVKLHREDVFFSLPGNYEAISPLKHFEENPEIGAEMEVVVNRLNPEDGLYEVSIPGTAMSVQDWSDIEAGMTVEAKVTGHNTGGLECEVNGIRAFMPVSQISLYRVEDLEQFLGEKWACVVNEANESRGNLVISRRGVLEREKAGQAEQLMQGLQVGQEREGVVRSIRDFGAFVDIGGIDGLIHVSKLSWDRVAHPSEILEEGQQVKVKIEKIEDGKIGLSYRDEVDHPWKKAADEFVPNAIVDGTVTKIMDFGAFVKLAPGVEGLVHISELAHHRVVRVANAVEEGQQVSVKILSVDPEQQRMSLSIKAVQAPPAKASGGKSKVEEVDEAPRESVVKEFQGKLKGGTNKKTGGESVGLNW